MGNLDLTCRLSRVGRTLIIAAALLALGAGMLLPSRTFAQAPTTCFPTCDEDDGRFITIAGSEISTFIGDTIRIGLATLASTDTLVLEIFDGETGGVWDNGVTPLLFTLYADPTGKGTGDHLVGAWVGTLMADNAWHKIRIPTSSLARAANGNYFYVLSVHSTNRLTASSSGFKLRLNGTITIKPGLSFDVIAPLPNEATARIIYPGYPGLGQTTYDGDWTLYLDIPSPISSLTLWDGDLDHGSYHGQDKDDDDPDTPNDRLLWWAIDTDALNEGVGHGNPATDSLGVGNGDTATGAPTDDERRPLFKRKPSIYYEIIDPEGNSYVNENPSGNREWEQFRISTAPFDRMQMDHWADSLPAGVYTLKIYGMDLANLNAFRLFADSLTDISWVGVDSSGGPVGPILPTLRDTGEVSGYIYYDYNTNSTRDLTEPGIGGLPLLINADYNNDGVTDKSYSATTDAQGGYRVTGLKNGKYTVILDSTMLGSGVAPTHDVDGLGTRHRGSVTLTATNKKPRADFGYRTLIGVSIAGPDTVTNGSTHTFTATATQTGATYQWTITGAGVINGPSNGQTVSVTATSSGVYQLKVTATKNGASATATKDVQVRGMDFVLFGYDYLYFEGRGGSDTTRGFINGGNVGVNRKASGCYANYPTLVMGIDCNSPNAVIMSNGTRVMGDYVRLGSKVNIYDLYANRTASGTLGATIRHLGPSSYANGVIIPTSQLPKVPSFSYNSTNITVPLNGTRTLAPGKYGTITVRDGATLTLGTGIYNVKAICVGRNANIITTAGTKVRIARNLVVGDDSYIGSSDAAFFVVRSDGICSGDPSIDLGERSEIHGQYFAPNGLIEIEKKADLTGRFWGKRIIADSDVNVTFYSPVTTLTAANNSGFQKKRQDAAMEAVTGGAGVALGQNFPNPFTTTTTIGYQLPESGTATIAIFDMNGREVRRLLDGVEKGSGAHVVEWDGRDNGGAEAANGVYFYRLQCGDVVETRSLVLSR